MLERVLKRIIPVRHRYFPKLTSASSPYYFDKWRSDHSGRQCLYYWFWDRQHIDKHKKRVPVNEIRSALRVLLRKSLFDREDYQNHCKVSDTDGPCGYAVIGRCLEYLKVANFAGVGQGFRLTNGHRAKFLFRKSRP